MDYFTVVTLASAGAVLVTQQILKLNLIPVAFANRYPVPTNIVLSVVAACIAVWKTSVHVTGFVGWAVFVGTVSVVAAVAYNQLLSKWTALKASEGPGK